MSKEATKGLRRYRMATALAAVAVMFAGCPITYQVELGDWIIHLSDFPIHITHGLTLDVDGDATPYEATPGYGTLPGTWTWATNGYNIWFMQFVNGESYTYHGKLLSESSATGKTYEGSYNGNTNQSIGEWEAVRDN